jgi:hypothetical protein
MAEVVLELQEAARGDLPLVCIHCGEPAHNHGLEKYPSLARVRWLFPLCGQHAGYWRFRTEVFLLIGFVAALLLAIVGARILAGIEAGTLKSIGTGLVLLATLAMLLLPGCYFCLRLSGTRIRKIGYTTITLAGVAPEFVEALRFHRDQRKGRAVRPPPEVESYPEEVAKLLRVAAQEATRLGHDYLGTEHILLALSQTSPGVAAVMQKHGLDYQRLCKAALEVTLPGPVVQPDVALTPAVKRVLTSAAEAARSRNHNAIGEELLFLCLLQEPQGSAGQVLQDLGLAPETVCQEAQPSSLS